MATENCKYCNRSGLPLLPLRWAYVPNPPHSLPSGLANYNPSLVTPLKEGYMLRAITDGYLYIYDEREGGFWRCFAATPSGHFREYPVDQRPSATPSFQCAMEGHASVASLININRASEAGDVWVGYSRVWWTKATRNLLKKDTTLRGHVMVKFNAGSIVKGASVPEKIGMRVESGKELGDLVGEYSNDEKYFDLINQRYASGTTRTAVNRHGQADHLVGMMHSISPNNAIVLALPDPIGIVQDINHWRNLQAGALAKYQSKAGKLRTRIIGDLVLGLEDSMRKQGQGEVWTERYEPKVSIDKIRADKKAHDAQLKKYEAAICSASDDWCKWANSDHFKRAWQVYDGMDAVDGKYCGAKMERDFSRCVFGSGGTKDEQEWWGKWLAADPEDKNHPIWLAFAAGDKDVVAYLKGDAAKPLDVGKTDKGVDLLKNSRDLAHKIKEWLDARRTRNLQRAAQAESGLLANAMATQLHVLARTQPVQALHAGQRLRIVIATRMDVVVTPHTYQVTLQQMVVQMHEAVWGPPKAKLASVTREARSLRISQNVEGAWLGSRFTSTKLVTVDVWLPDPVIQMGSIVSAPSMPNAGLIPLARPSLNAWEGLTEYIKGLKGAGQGLLGLGAALQISNLSANLIQLDRSFKGNAANRDDAMIESIYGIVSGTLGLLALTAEVFAGSIAARMAPATVSATATRLLATAGWTALGGAILGVVAAGVDATQAFAKRSALRSEGDNDAATSYSRAGTAAIFAGVASGALAVIGAGSLLAGATGAATMVAGAAGVLSMIPVAGWIVLAIGATLAGLYFAYKASTQEDTSLEKWLSRCIWRNDAVYRNTSRTKFSDLKQEMAEFQQAIYGVSVTLNWNDRWGKDEVEVNVTMPGYTTKNSDYAFLLELNGKKWKRTVVHRRTSAFSSDVDLKPQAKVQATIGPIPVGQRTIPMEEVLEFSEPISLRVEGGTAVLAGRVLINEDYFHGAKLKFEYWPDVISHPDLKMIPVPGGANFAEASD